MWGRLLDGLINYGGWGLVSADAPGPGLGPARLLGNRLAPAGRPPLETAPQLSLGPPPPPLTRLLRQRPCSLSLSCFFFHFFFWWKDLFSFCEDNYPALVFFEHSCSLVAIQVRLLRYTSSKIGLDLTRLKG